MDLPAAFAGVAALHLAGAVLRALASPGLTLRAALASPSSALIAVATLHLLSLGLAGAALLLATGAVVLVTRPPAPATAPPFPWWWAAALLALLLARPLVPTSWDEFVWLGKARLEALGPGSAARLSLDAAQHLIPPGYPTLWPTTVGWASLTRDTLGAQVAASVLLVWLCSLTALEVWLPRLKGAGAWAWLAAAAAPLVWVHLRTTYLDLPVGLLGVALLGHLLAASERDDLRPSVMPFALAVVLVGAKDDGAAHVVAAVVAALAVARARRAWRLAAPGAVGLAVVAAWRALLHLRGAANVDHVLSTPAPAWFPKLIQLGALHASDVWSWGVFWAVALVLALVPRSADGRAARAMLACCAALMALGLLVGPERVRVFAENGTLLNRLLIQLWPAAAVLVVSGLGARQGDAVASSAGQHAPA